MSVKLVNDDSLTDVADAIRIKGEISGTLEFPDGFISAIQAIPTGGITPSGTIQITQNGVVDVTNYASADVNVSGGGSSWTKVAETTITTSATSTSVTTIDTWNTDMTSIWTSDKWVYIRVRDTAGKRPDYFYGSDQWIMNSIPYNQLSTTSWGGGIRNTIYVDADGIVQVYPSTNTTGYGVYADQLYADGRIRLRKRYSSNYSHTVNGTYKVEVFLLDTPEGTSPFA